jgi:general secretion pathway protein A
MYHQYFGLSEAPFSIAVNPRYLFMSTRHRDALAHLLYGVGSGGGFILLTGEVGTGKTTINRCLLEQLPEDTDVAIILNPALNALELLASACDELGIDYDSQSPTLKTLTDKLHAFLLENHAKGRNTVLMIDEAQHLDFEVLEQIRLLTNLETNNQKLLQIILIGQPELAQLLNRPELRQLSQRITARYNLEPLNLEETRAYIRHRLSVAGLVGNREIFPDAVVRELFKLTRGIPRLINVLCDRILLGAYGQNKLRADRKMLQVAAHEVMGEDQGSSVSHSWARRGLLAVGIIVLVALGAGVGFGLKGDPDKNIQVLRSAVEAAPAVTEQAIVATAEKVVQVAPAAPVVESLVEQRTQAWLISPDTALLQLWTLYSAESPPENICNSEAQSGLACVVEDAQTWQELMQFSRPIVLDMVTPERFSASVLLLGIQGRSARVFDGEGVSEVPLAELGPGWRGTYRFLWRPPSGFTSPLFLGQRSTAVAEVASLFARLDGQEKSLSGDTFNAALKQRVVLFQRQYDLVDDGVVGMKTLLKLNELLSVDVSNAQAESLLQSALSATGVQ